MSESDNEKLKQVVSYMQAHWPSKVKEEWRVKLEEYPAILSKVIKDFTPEKTKKHQLIRIAGLSGSGKTSQILPAVEKYCEGARLNPILIAARRFVEYHPYKKEIEKEYGEENLRKNTDEFSTIMMFLAINTLTKAGYDIILDVTLLAPEIENILLNMLGENNYNSMLLMIATSPEVTEHFLSGRSWRHSKATEQEFIRATKEALDFYAKNDGNLHLILWSVYDLEPIYNGPVKDGLAIFQKYSEKTDLPPENDEERKQAKIQFLSTLCQ